jgi:hypothetical protein
VSAARSGGCALVLVALVAAGCGGRDEAAESERPVTAHAPAAEAASTTASAEAAGEAAATEPEVAWAGRVIDWAIMAGSAVEFVEANTEALEEGKPLPLGVRQPVAQALRALAECPRSIDEIGRPPSERLVPVESALRLACDHYAAGAAGALELVAGAASDAQALRAEWEQAWEEGEALIRSVADGLREFQPANTRTLPERAGVTRVSRVEPEFGALASELVDADVEVRCWSRRDWEVLLGEMKRFTRGRIGEGTVGFAGYRDHRVNLAPEICDTLVALRYEHARPAAGKALALAAIAVATLMHEAQHVRGVWNEPGAECYGMQMVREAARRLGAPRRYAARLADTYWADLYELLPPTYRSRECRDVGAMDADPASAVWP